MALTAIPVGFVAGLFGIGGGLITVPFLFYIFGSLDFDQSYIMHLAVGTSFAIIIPTSIVSVLTHKKHKSVEISIIKNYTLEKFNINNSFFKIYYYGNPKKLRTELLIFGYLLKNNQGFWEVYLNE